METKTKFLKVKNFLTRRKTSAILFIWDRGSEL